MVKQSLQSLWGKENVFWDFYTWLNVIQVYRKQINLTHKSTKEIWYTLAFFFGKKNNLLNSEIQLTKR